MTSETSRPEYSVVVPVYESGSTVRELVERLRSVFDETLLAPWEVILVDDGSRSPETWATCQELAREDERVTAIRLMRNYGKPGAVLCGLGHVRGLWVITIDDDLQQRPEDIPALACHRQHDVVVAHFTNRRHGALTTLGSWIKSHFDRIILDLPCRMSPLKLFKAEVAAGMLRVRTPHPFIPALMACVTKDFVSVAVRHEASRHRKSRYTFGRRLLQFSNLLINNSSLLLRGLGVAGVLVGLGGFLYAASVVLRRLAGSPIQTGWPSLVVINLIFGGLILIALSLVGEYLIRILEGISEKPPYFIRTVVAAGGRATEPSEPQQVTSTSDPSP